VTNSEGVFDFYIPGQYSADTLQISYLGYSPYTALVKTASGISDLKVSLTPRIIVLDDAYGVSVKRYIKQETGRDVNISAVHEALKRLQRKGFLESNVGGATQVRGGRRKRFFVLTIGGRNTLEEIMNLKLQLYKKVPNFSLKLT